MCRCRPLVPLAGVLIGLAGCTSDRGDLTAPPVEGADEATGAADGRADATITTVGIIGDSITVGSEAAIVEAVEGLGVEVVTVDAASGRRLVADGVVGSGVEAASRVGPLDPDLWVVALGTNDVPNLDTVDEYAVAIDEMLGAIPDDAPLVWVDVYVGGDVDASEEFNRVLRERLEDRGAAVVADWSDRAGEDGVLRDGVHPTELGGLLFAEVVAAGVAAWLA